MKMDWKLPTFFVIGAYKCATTSLHHYFGQHPDVYMPEKKELLYWAFATDPDTSHPSYQRSVKTLDDYRRQFANVDGERAVGEVSPEYMARSHVACPAIRRQNPDAGIIAILRNPIQRAWSDYLMYVASGEERANFVSALAAQSARQARGARTGYYLATGLYGRQLAPYFDSFPTAQIRVVLTEDLQQNPFGTLSDLFRFVGAEPGFKPELRRYMQSLLPVSTTAKYLGKIGRRLPEPYRTRWTRKLYSKPRMPAEARLRLMDWFADDIELTERLIGRDLSSWKRPH